MNAAQGPEKAQPRLRDRSWFKAPVVVAVLALYVFAFLPVMAFTIFFGGYARGVGSKPLFFVVLILPVLVFSLILRRREWPRWVWVGQLVAAGALSGLVLVSATSIGAPSAEELATEADRVGVPEGWVLIDEERSKGSPVCFDSCPTACREYRTPNDPAQAVDELRRRFDEAGYATRTQAAELSGPGFVGRASHRYVRAIVENQRVPPDYERSERILQLCLRGVEVP